MSENTLARLFEHNNWANRQIIDCCLALSDEQLDAEPRSATFGSIRRTLIHLVTAQQGYLRLLLLPFEQRQEPVKAVAFTALQEAATASGEEFLALVRDEERLASLARLRTHDGYHVDPWVIIVQAINHATEHREQIKSMLTALRVTPPDIDGWSYGEVAGGLVKI